MKIDFHTHGKLAKKLPFSKEYTKWLFQEAKANGLDAICLTEHFNTIGFSSIYEYLDMEFEKYEDSYLYEGLQIFAGMEIDILEGGHILVIGSTQEILRCNAVLEPFKTKQTFLRMRDLLKITNNYQFILGGAHPFRMGSNIPMLQEDEIKQFDFVDLNGKDMAFDSEYTKKMTMEFAKDYNLKVLAGSDTHQSIQYGCIYNEFNQKCNTIKELREVIENDNYQIIQSASIQSQVYYAGILKRSLKEVYLRGGDYVSILVGEE